MKTVVVRFLQPWSISGSIAAWRLVEPYGHAVIIFGDRVFNAKPPRVEEQELTDPSISFPSREGIDVPMSITDQQYETMLAWCEEQVGKWYDLRSIVAWVFGLPKLGNKETFYCFEYCRESFVQAGIMPPETRLISGERLLLDLFRASCTCGSTLPQVLE